MKWKLPTVFSYFYLLTIGLTAQVDTLTSQELKSFGEVATYMYNELENNVLNILDPNISKEDLRVSIADAKNAFSVIGKIEDIFEHDAIQSHRYFELLRNQYEEYNFIQKKWKKLKSPIFERVPGTGVLIDDQNRREFARYRADILFQEDFSRNRKEDGFSEVYAFDKQLVFEVRKETLTDWKIYMMKIITPNNQELENSIAQVMDVKKAKSGLNRLGRKTPNNPTNTVVMKDEMSLPMAKDPGSKSAAQIKEEKENEQNEPTVLTETPLVINYDPIDPLKFGQYLVPGIGHLHFGKQKQKLPLAMGYGVTTAAALTSGVVFKLRSNEYFDRYETATSPDEINSNLAIANRAEKLSWISFGTAAGLYLGNIIHLSIRNNKQKRSKAKKVTYLDTHSRKKVKIQLLPFQESGLGVTQIITF